jgi:phenylacetate-CoA ligase
MSREEMSELQTERLIRMVKRVYNNVPFYHDKMQRAGIDPGDVKSMEDLKKLPFTDK